MISRQAALSGVRRPYVFGIEPTRVQVGNKVEVALFQTEIMMKHEKLLAGACRALCALALIAGSSAALAQSMDKKPAAMPGMSAMAAGGDMHGSMMGMMKSMESMKMTGDPDRDFAMMMKVHHQGAIDMAQMELQRGKDAKMRAMAKEIIKAQQKEIKVLDKWLANRK